MPTVHLEETSTTGDWAGAVWAEQKQNTWECEVDAERAKFLLAGKPDDPKKFPTMFHCLESLGIAGFPAKLVKPLVGQRVGKCETLGPDYRSVPGGTRGTAEKFAEVPPHCRPR